MRTEPHRAADVHSILTSGRRARHRLRQRGPEGEVVRVAVESEAVAGPGGADHQGAELPEIQRGEVQTDQREHQPESPVVGPGSDRHPPGYGHLADEAPQELLRGQEARLERQTELLTREWKRGLRRVFS